MREVCSEKYKLTVKVLFPKQNRVKEKNYTIPIMIYTGACST